MWGCMRVYVNVVACLIIKIIIVVIIIIIIIIIIITIIIIIIFIIIIIIITHTKREVQRTAKKPVSHQEPNPGPCNYTPQDQLTDQR